MTFTLFLNKVNSLVIFFKHFTWLVLCWIILTYQPLKGFCHKKIFLVCCSSKKVVQKTCLQYIEILSQSKDIYILNFVFTFNVFSSIAIFFICTQFLLSFSIVFGIIIRCIKKQKTNFFFFFSHDFIKKLIHRFRKVFICYSSIVSKFCYFSAIWRKYTNILSFVTSLHCEAKYKSWYILVWNNYTLSMFYSWRWLVCILDVPLLARVGKRGKSLYYSSKFIHT